MSIRRVPIYIFGILRDHITMIHIHFLWRTHLLTQISFKTGVGQHHHSHQSVLDDVSQTTERVVGSGSAIVQFPGKRSMARKYEFR